MSRLSIMCIALWIILFHIFLVLIQCDVPIFETSQDVRLSGALRCLLT